MLDRGWHSGSVFGTTRRRWPPARWWPVPRSVGGRTAPGRHSVVRPDGRPVRGDEQTHASRPGGAQRVLRSGARSTGYTGIKRVFEREYGGFLSVFGEGHPPTPTHSPNDLCKRWETSVIMVKSYAAMGGSRRDRARAIAHIGGPETHFAHRHHRRHHDLQTRVVDPRTPIDPDRAQMHLGYTTAAALLDGNVCPNSSPQRAWMQTTSGVSSSAPKSTSTRRATVPSASARHRPRRHQDGSNVHRVRVDQPHGAPAIRSPMGNSSPSSTRWPTGHEPRPRHRDRARRGGPRSLDDIGDLVDLLAAPVAGAVDERSLMPTTPARRRLRTCWPNVN